MVVGSLSVVASLKDIIDKVLGVEPIAKPVRMCEPEEPMPMVSDQNLKVEPSLLASIKRNSFFDLPAPAVVSVDDAPAVDLEKFAPRAGRAAGPFSDDPEVRLEQAKAILETQNEWPPEPNKVYFVQIDVDPPPRPRWPTAPQSQREEFKKQMQAFAEANAAVHDFVPHYNDGQLIVVQAVQGDDGEMKLVHLAEGEVFPAAAHPGQFECIKDPETDTCKDPLLPWVMAGVHPLKAKYYNGGFAAAQPLPAVRLRNNANGVPSEGEVEQAKKRHTFATEVMIHAGHPDNEEILKSGGCGNVKPTPFKKRLVPAVKKAVEDLKLESITWVLVRRPNVKNPGGVTL